MTDYKAVINGQYVPLEFEQQEMSSGGQGHIFRIQSPATLNTYCAKIYKDENHAKQNKEKVEYMISHKPVNKDMKMIRICWPEYMILDHSGAFVGFLMLRAFENSRDLKIIEIHTIGKTIAEKYPKNTDWHGKYELDDPMGFVNRMKMLLNWALATEIIHSSGQYVIVDLKPENVLATATGKLSIVDTDSFQIDNQQKHFDCPVATPEYFAKFAKERFAKKMPQTYECDSFALAVAFYKILIGSHPFSGFKLLPPYDTDEYADIASRIDADLFVFGKNKQYIEQLKVNNMHSRFDKLPEVLKNLFMQAFNGEHQPTATEWKKALQSICAPGSRLRVPVSPRAMSSSSNFESRCLCTLVLDVSGSMKICINTLNKALSNFFADLRCGKNGFKEVSKNQIEIAIVQFDRDVQVLRNPSLIEDKEDAPMLRVRGLTTNTGLAIRKAISITEARKAKFKDSGITYFRPWIVLLTDGNPNPYNKDDIKHLIEEVHIGLSKHKFILTAIGIGTKVDRRFLSDISDNHYKYISQSNISDLFEALSGSISGMSKSIAANPQEDLLGSLNKSVNYDL